MEGHGVGPWANMGLAGPLTGPHCNESPTYLPMLLQALYVFYFFKGNIFVCPHVDSIFRSGMS